jgi:hypothetical protein
VHAFFDVPFRVYAAASPYVSPLRSDVMRALDVGKNPLFTDGKGVRKVLTAHRGGEPVGRIVAHVHGASNELHRERRASFGFFDCADDVEAARLLLGAAEEFGRGQGCDTLTGNFNLTAMQQMGVLTEGFDAPPYADMQYNPPHVPRLLETCGFARTFPITTFEVDLRALDPEGFRSSLVDASLADSELRWDVLRARHLDRILEDVREVLNDGFRRNPMFVPLSPAEMRFQARDLGHILDPRITTLVHDAEGPAGVTLCIPDFNPMLRDMRSRLTLTAPWFMLKHRIRRRRAVLVFCSVAQRKQKAGLSTAMLYRVTVALKQCGYTSLGITWVSDANAVVHRQMTRLGARPLHRLHLYTKALSALEGA